MTHGTPHHVGETELSVVHNRGHHESPHHNMSRTEDRSLDANGNHEKDDRHGRGWSDHRQ